MTEIKMKEGAISSVSVTDIDLIEITDFDGGDDSGEYDFFVICGVRLKGTESNVCQGCGAILDDDEICTTCE